MKKCLLLSGLSGVLLFLAFPNFYLGFTAWFALVPLLAALSSCRSRSQALRCGLVTGLIFFGVSVHWMTFVLPFVWFSVVLLETSFVVLFAWFVYEGLAVRRAGFRLLWIPLAWTAAEFARSEIPVFGGGFNALAFSQSGYLCILQAAGVAGVYGLGFLIVFVNACLFQMFQPPVGQKKGSVLVRGAWLVPVFAALAALNLYGYFQLRTPVSGTGGLRIALTQGNIPQNLKWEPELKEKIITAYLKLTELASYERPHLIVWPEAAFPGYFNIDPAGQAVRELVKKTGVPVLVGSPHLVTPQIAFNSAYLVDATGETVDRYDKLHLVPFGEYVPLKKIFGWLAPLAYTLGVSDFEPGVRDTVFDFLNGDLPFSVLICFEDLFPAMARRFVNRGARFLIVITNDAWFGPTAAPYQHLQASVFRAVENGVPVVRSANTGVSAFISARGEVLGRVRGLGGKDIFVMGHKTMQLPMEFRQTLYRRGGYLFPYGVLLVFFSMGVWVAVKKDGARKMGSGDEGEKGQGKRGVGKNRIGVTEYRRIGEKTVRR